MLNEGEVTTIPTIINYPLSIIHYPLSIYCKFLMDNRLHCFGKKNQHRTFDIKKSVFLPSNFND